MVKSLVKIMLTQVFRFYSGKSFMQWAPVVGLYINGISSALCAKVFDGHVFLVKKNTTMG